MAKIESSEHLTSRRSFVRRGLAVGAGTISAARLLADAPAAFEVLDDEMPEYIHDNTDDEITHAAFINAYLMSKGAEPVDLDRFRTLPSSQASGAQQIGRL